MILILCSHESYDFCVKQIIICHVVYELTIVCAHITKVPLDYVVATYHWLLNRIQCGESIRLDGMNRKSNAVKITVVCEN